MASRPTRKVDLVELGMASFSPEAESGDLFVTQCNSDRTLFAAIDGIGHGKEAATAARVAASVLESFTDDSLIALVEKCHDALRSTRGVVLSLALIDSQLENLTWLGIGNVQGVLIRSSNSQHKGNHALLLRPGVVGSRLPALQTMTLPISRGDILAFATDGIRSDFSDDLFPSEPPQRLADRILAKHCKGNDEALIFVVRFMGGAE